MDICRTRRRNLICKMYTWHDWYPRLKSWKGLSIFSYKVFFTSHYIKIFGRHFRLLNRRIFKYVTKQKKMLATNRVKAHICTVQLRVHVTRTVIVNKIGHLCVRAAVARTASTPTPPPPLFFFS